MRKLLASCLLSLVSVAANAATVSRVDVYGNQRMDSESVRLLANVKAGDDINSEALNQIAKRLQQSGYFSTVNARMDGGALRISVSESPVVSMTTVEGNSDISTEDLKKEIRMKERSSYDESVIGADVQRMLAIYQRKGFFGTRINPK